MFKVDVYLRVRRAVMVDGMSTREAARVFGLHRDTVRKILAYSIPPGYRRQNPPKRPKLKPFAGVIDRILEDDLRRPRKQRHTAKRIFERLRDEYWFDGGYTTVKDYVRENRCQTREVFVPFPMHRATSVRPWRSSAAEQKAHYFVIDLPHSDGCFVAANTRRIRRPVVAETVKGWRNQAPAPKQASALIAEALARIRETARLVRGTPLKELDHRRGVAIPGERTHLSETKRANFRSGDYQGPKTVKLETGVEEYFA